MLKRLIWGAAVALALGACGDLEGDLSDEGQRPENSGGDNNGFGFNNGTNNGATNNGDVNNGFEPEPEERFNFQAPQPSRNYVFVANTALDTVARIDGDTLEIVSVEVGDEPTVVRAWAESDVAAVLNEGSDDVSIIHSGQERVDVVTLPIREGFNQLIMAPGGEHALAYLDYTDYEPGDDLGRFQDVNLIRLREGEEEVFNVAVGFRVLEIEFDEDGERAFVITEDGISVIRMDEVTRDTSAQPIAVSADLGEDALAVDREVEITRDGSLALVRSSVLEGVNLINLRDRALIEIPLPGVPTDLDIYPDSGRAVAVLKGPRQVAKLELGALLGDPEAVELIEIPEGPLGLAAVDFGSDVALLYSVSEPSPEVTRLELSTGAQVVWDVRKSLRGVHISPAGDRAMLFHLAADQPRSNDPADVYLANSHAYTLLDLQTGFTKLQTAPTEPGEFVFSGDNRYVFVVLNDVAAQVRQVDRVQMESFRVDSYALGSAPEHIGLLPSDTLQRIYVSQQHRVGRMTFIDIETGDSRTVTGYELNSQIQ